MTPNLESYRRPRLSRAWWLLAIPPAFVLGGLAWTLPDMDPVRALERRRLTLTGLLREPHSRSPSIERWRLVTTSGDTLSALWRPAIAAEGRAWTVVTMGGLGTGDRVAQLIPPSAPAHVLAMDWPWRGPRRMSHLTFLINLPRIREALLRTPAVLAAGVEAALRDTLVDPERLAMVGASLGAPPVVAALRLTGAPRAVVLVDGGADLPTLLNHTLRREGLPGWLAIPAAGAGAWLLRPLEPLCHAPAARRIPVLLSNARTDERLPARCVARLRDSLPHAEARWREAPHIRPSQEGALASLTFETVAWLEGLSPASVSVPEPPAAGGGPRPDDRSRRSR